MEYIIGSFNMDKMNDRDDIEKSKNLDQIAKIIKNEGFDIIALQEVLTQKIVDKLMKYLGNGYSYEWMISNSYKSSKMTEGYAYIWKKDRISLAEANSNPWLLEVKKGKLARPPMMVRFKPTRCFFEIRLINTHIVFRDDGARKEREEEFQTLEESYFKFSGKRYGNYMPSYTILLGDYNLCLKEVLYILPKLTMHKPDMLVTVQGEKTTLKKNPPENSMDYYANDYDHFSYAKSLENRIGIQPSRVDALGTYYHYDLAKYRREISDHVPIKLTLNLRRNS